MAEEKILKSQAITLTQKIPIQPLKTPENLCFYTPWKQQKTSDVLLFFRENRKGDFLVFSGGIEWEH